MTFFDNLHGRSARSRAPTAIAPDTDPFAGQGFVYHETRMSPDGTLKVLNGYSGGEKGPTIIEVKVVIAATGRVLIDLWHTYQNCSLQFSATDNTAQLHVQNPHDHKQNSAIINFTNETCALTNNPAVWHELAKLPEVISTF